MHSVEGGGNGKGPSEEGSGGTGSREAGALIWTAGTGKSKRLEDRAGEVAGAARLWNLEGVVRFGI